MDPAAQAVSSLANELGKNIKRPTEAEFLEGVAETFVGIENTFNAVASLRVRMNRMQLLMDHCAGAIALRLVEIENETVKPVEQDNGETNVN